MFGVVLVDTIGDDDDAIDDVRYDPPGAAPVFVPGDVDGIEWFVEVREMLLPRLLVLALLLLLADDDSGESTLTDVDMVSLVFLLINIGSFGGI